MEINTGTSLRDIDAPLAEAYEGNVEGPIRVRVQPTVWIPRQDGTGYRQQWRKVIWNLQFKSFEEAVSFRLVLQEFFTALALVGPTALRVHLAGLRKPVETKP